MPRRTTCGSSPCRAATAPAFRGIMLKGNAGVEVAGELWPIALLMPAAGTVAMRRYRQTRD